MPGGGRSSSRTSDEALRIASSEILVGAGNGEVERVGLRVGDDRDLLVLALEEGHAEELEGEGRRCGRRNEDTRDRKREGAA